MADVQRLNGSPVAEGDFLDFAGSFTTYVSK